jgi:hypothetical protein
MSSVYDAETFVNLGYVNQSYRIATFETTNSQYARFLNAVATGINYTSSGLYDTRMSSDNSGGILRTSNGLVYSYTTKIDMANKPVNFVSYLNAIKFTNWLHNGTPSGNAFANKFIEEVLEDGAYSIFTENDTYLISYNDNKKYFLPNINQWHKAAYFEPVSTILVSGKPVTTINTDSPYIVATEKLPENSPANTVPKQLFADLTVSGWLVVDRLIVKDGTIRSPLTNIGFEPEVPTAEEEESPTVQNIVAGAIPTSTQAGGSSSNTFWSNSTASPRVDGVFGTTSPPLPPNGNGEDIDCDDPELIDNNNVPFWCRPNGRLIGPYFY